MKKAESMYFDVTCIGIGGYNFAKFVKWEKSICNETDSDTYELYFEITRTADWATKGEHVVGEFLDQMEYEKEDVLSIGMRAQFAPHFHNILMSLDENYPDERHVQKVLDGCIGKEYLVKVTRETRNRRYWQGVTEVIPIPETYDS